MSELELRQQRGSLPQDVLVTTVADRQEPLGSGGATLNALLVAAEHLSNRAGHTVSYTQPLEDRPSGVRYAECMLRVWLV